MEKAEEVEDGRFRRLIAPEIFDYRALLNAEEGWELVDHDEEPSARRKADEHGFAHETRQAAHPGDTRDELKNADHQGKQDDVVGGVAICCEGRDATRDHDGDRVRRSVDEIFGATEGGA